ncbi:SH3-like domain-containing protein [Microbispora sp. H13382]|uniref:SH3-like domain-containing protein n=1 Tax=Microbispora sp. H13382 TaxID=2729112 RepID=UPI001601F5F3
MASLRQGHAEIRRRMENDLGATQYYGLPYYARWITTAARVLVEKGIVTTDELGRKVDEIRTRRREELS